MEIEENFITTLFDKKSFILQLFSGTVVPVTQENYYHDRIEINLIQGEEFNNYSVQIEKNQYDINHDKLENIKTLLMKNFSKLIEVSLHQETKIYFGGGTNLNIKIKGVYIMIDRNSLTPEDKQFIDDIIKQLVEIIKN